MDREIRVEVNSNDGEGRRNRKDIIVDHKPGHISADLVGHKRGGDQRRIRDGGRTALRDSQERPLEGERCTVWALRATSVQGNGLSNANRLLWVRISDWRNKIRYVDRR